MFIVAINALLRQILTCFARRQQQSFYLTSVHCLSYHQVDSATAFAAAAECNALCQSSDSWKLRDKQKPSFSTDPSGNPAT